MNRTTPEIAIWADVRRQPDDRRPPAALLLGAAFLIQLLWVGLGHGVGVGNAVLIGGVAGLAFAISLWLTVPAALLAGGTAFLTIDGFVQGGYGTLTWTGAGDVLLIGALVAGCALLAEAAYEMWWSRPRRSRPTRDTVLTPWWYDDTLVELSCLTRASRHTQSGWICRLHDRTRPPYGTTLRTPRRLRTPPGDRRHE